MVLMNYLNNLKLKVASIILLGALAGCGSTSEVTTSVQNPVLKPIDPAPINTKQVSFKVINSSTIDSIDINTNSWYAVNAKGYENLAYNMQEILRYVKEQRAVIEYYETTAIDNNIN